MYLQFVLTFIWLWNLSKVLSINWSVKEQLHSYGEDLVLVCTAYNCCNNTVTKRWYGGPKQKPLMLNEAESTEKAKYSTEVLDDSFILIIRNLTEHDLNVNYECSYGFKTEKKVLTKKDVFQSDIVDSSTVRIITTEPSVIEQGAGDNKSTIIEIVIGSVIGSILAVAVVVGIVVVVRKRRNACQIRRNGHLQEPDIEGRLETVQLNTADTETVNVDVTDGLLQNKEHSTESNQTLTDGSEKSSSKATTSGYSTDDETTPLKAHSETSFTTTPATKTTQDNSLLGSYTAPSTQSRVEETGDNSMELDGPQTKTLSEQEIYIHGEEGHICIHLAYKQLTLRRKSFTEWFEPQKVGEMSKAGFFFLVTVENDYAQCFCCDSKRRWKTGDDPFDMVFHNNCSYITKIREDGNAVDHTDETCLKSV